MFNIFYSSQTYQLAIPILFTVWHINKHKTFMICKSYFVANIYLYVHVYSASGYVKQMSLMMIHEKS